MNDQDRPGRDRYPLARPFPIPGRGLRRAYAELDQAAYGDDDQQAAIGDPAALPRPWDPGSITNLGLRAELWAWLEAVVDWVNTEHVWDPAHLIPACWPRHPHLVHELAVLADQRHKASRAIASDALEEWHRYALPAFFDRRRTRLRTMCDSTHHDWPARPAHTRHQHEYDARRRDYDADLDYHQRTCLPTATTGPVPWLRIIDGHHVDPDTGEVL